ncbi:glycosyltransferase [Oleiharenicola sp. Vm1]|uniref:glycosyltransferase n=1 Tax=Oleiharenicola sp. Vm1 TaxID=3398393 RepID=UPI0039F53151
MTGRRRRILLDLLPYSPSDGGFTTSIHALLEVATRLEEFEFGIVYHSDYRARFASYPFRHHVVNFPRKMKFFAPLAIIPPLVRWHGYHAVHSDISAAVTTTVPTSMRVHDLFYLISGESRNRPWLHEVVETLYRRIYVQSIRTAGIAAAISECTRRDIVRHAGRSATNYLLPHAVALPASTPVARDWPDKERSARLLFVGSIVPRKNLRTLLAALRQVRRAWTLDIVGNVWWGATGLGDELRDPRITVRGFVPDGELARHYATADLLINPSLYEGFGLPVAEAVAAGCPAFAASGSAFDEFVPALARFDPHDPPALARLIDALSPDAHRALLAAEFAALQRFSRAGQIAAYRAVFRRLVADVPEL